MEHENGPCEYVWKYTNRKIASPVIIAKYAYVTRTQNEKKKTRKNVYGVHEEDRIGDREKEKMKRERSFDFPSTNRDRGTFIAVAVYHIGMRMYNHQKALIIR